MSTYDDHHCDCKLESNADKLRELIGVGAGLSPSDPGETFRARHKVELVL